MAKEANRNKGGIGAGVDLFGGPVVDPTKNVLDLVKAESKYQDAMRDMTGKLRDVEDRRLEDLSVFRAKYAEDLSKAETRRVDALEEQRVRYEARIAEDLRVNVKTTSDQLAGQLIKETGALNNQIGTLNSSLTNQMSTQTNSLSQQIAGITAQINPRLADLERFRWETGGKAAVADPALTVALSEMAKSIAALKDVATRGVGQQEEKVTARTGLGLQISLAVAAIAAVELLLHFLK